MDILLIGLVRTTVLLSVAAIVVWALLKAARVSSSKIQRAACCLVLLQGWVFWQMPVEIPYYEQTVPETLPMVVETYFLPLEEPILPEVYAQAPLAAAAPSEPISYTPWLIAVWLFGMSFYVLCLAGRYLLFLRRLPPGRPCKNEWSRQWARLLDERGVRRQIPLRVTTLSGPALCRLPGGYELLIPSRFWKGLSPTGRLAILEHELAHYQRRDGLKSLAVRLLVLPQWFNPLAWIVVRRFDECAEWACDRRAIGDGSHRASEYANALLRLGRFVGGHPSYSPAARGRSLSVRVRRLVSNYSMEDSVMKRISVIGTVAIIAVFCLIRVELVAKEPVEKTRGGDEPVAETAIKPAKPKPPSEAKMVSLPTYRIEPPDVIQIEVLKLMPLPTYHIENYDVLQVKGLNTLPDKPINNHYIVDEGKINLGPSYGWIRVVGMTIDEANDAVRKHLLGTLRKPKVSVQLARASGLQPVTGAYLVGPDGTVNLRKYGSVYVSGMTVAEAKLAIERQLGKLLDSPEVSVDISGYNSKTYYIITGGAGKGDNVLRVPITGKETVLDAISQVKGLSQLSSKKIWISRPAPGGVGTQQILLVDWNAIAHGGKTAGNYQIMPGDRVFIKPDPDAAAPAPMKPPQTHPKASAPRYEVRMLLTQTDADGRKKVLSRPTVMTAEGESACVHIGGETPILIPQSSNTVSIDYLPYGNSFKFTIYKRHDKIYLDGTFKHTVVQDSDRKLLRPENRSLQILGKELRIIRPIKLGKKFTVSLADPEEKGLRTSLEIMVERFEGTSVAKDLKKSKTLKR